MSTDTQNRAAYRNPSYQTEIAEEEDFLFQNNANTMQKIRIIIQIKFKIKL